MQGLKTHRGRCWCPNKIASSNNRISHHNNNSSSSRQHWAKPILSSHLPHSPRHLRPQRHQTRLDRLEVNRGNPPPPQQQQQWLYYYYHFRGLIGGFFFQCRNLYRWQNQEKDSHFGVATSSQSWWIHSRKRWLCAAPTTSSQTCCTHPIPIDELPNHGDGAEVWAQCLDLRTL